jgi:prepilin-type N-terminal cleavage/methylation domain-containing protein
MSRAGFTLIEVLIAVVLAAICASIAAAVFLGSTDILDRLTRAAAVQEERALARAWLDEALNASIVAADSSSGFRGGARDMTFRTALWVPQGWVEPTGFHASIRDGELRLQTDDGPVARMRSVAAGSFSYLGDLGAASPWLARWDSFVAPPVAVRTIFLTSGGTADTLLFYLGRR